MNLTHRNRYLESMKLQRKKMLELAETLIAGTTKAQCYTIANYKLEIGETIANRLVRDHYSFDGALRAATLMVNAGCAKEVKNEKPYNYGKFIFLDGSELN